MQKGLSIRGKGVRVQLPAEARELVPSLSYTGEFRFIHARELRRIIRNYHKRIAKCRNNELPLSYTNIIANLNIITNPNEDVFIAQYPIIRELRDAAGSMVKAYRDLLGDGIVNE